MTITHLNQTNAEKLQTYIDKSLVELDCSYHIDPKDGQAWHSIEIMAFGCDDCIDSPTKEELQRWLDKVLKTYRNPQIEELEEQRENCWVKKANRPRFSIKLAEINGKIWNEPETLPQQLHYLSWNKDINQWWEEDVEPVLNEKFN